MALLSQAADPSFGVGSTAVIAEMPSAALNAMTVVLAVGYVADAVVAAVVAASGAAASAIVAAVPVVVVVAGCEVDEEKLDAACALS